MAASRTRSYAHRAAGDGMLVFSRAYLVRRPVSRRRGVVVLPARMLARHLRGYPRLLPAGEVRRLHDRLGRALASAADAGGA